MKNYKHLMAAEREIQSFSEQTRWQVIQFQVASSLHIHI